MWRSLAIDLVTVSPYSQVRQIRPHYTISMACSRADSPATIRPVPLDPVKVQHFWLVCLSARIIASINLKLKPGEISRGRLAQPRSSPRWMTCRFQPSSWLNLHSNTDTYKLVPCSRWLIAGGGERHSDILNSVMGKIIQCTLLNRVMSTPHFLPNLILFPKSNLT